MGEFDAVTDPAVKAMLLQMTIFTTVLIPFISGIMEAIKRTFTHIPNQYYTIITIVIAIALSCIGWIFTDLPAVYRLWAGLMAGLSAAKIYDIGKNVVNGMKKE